MNSQEYKDLLHQQIMGTYTLADREEGKDNPNLVKIRFYKEHIVYLEELMEI